MPDSSVHFVIDAASPGGLDRIIDALGPKFHVEQSSSGRLTRTWLDTDDWRLQQAGLVLEHSTDQHGDALVLHDGDDRVRSQPIEAIKWPALIDALPNGPVRQSVADVVGIRALLPTASIRTARRDLRVLDAESKTVVRLTIESGSRVERTSLPDRLSVTAVRGYRAQADRVSARLSTVQGLSYDEGSTYERALQALGRAFGDDVQPPVDLSAAMPAPTAIIAVLQGFLATVERTFDGVIADVDTEFLHDFRVAVRRSRSTLKLTGDVQETSSAQRLGGDLKWIGDLTSPTRDLDVYLLALPDISADLQSAEPDDLDAFEAYLRAGRRTEFSRLKRALRSKKFAQARDRWAALSLETDPSDSAPVSSVGAVAADRIARAHHRVTKRGRAIDADSPPEDLHDLRKRCKELRYLLEIFRPLHRPKVHRGAVKDLKALQEVLGIYQDGSVQGLAVREFAATMLADGSAPAHTVMAMGELAAGLTARQQDARADFADRFAEFDSPRSRRRFRELTGSA